MSSGKAITIIQNRSEMIQKIGINKVLEESRDIESCYIERENHEKYKTKCMEIFFEF